MSNCVQILTMGACAILWSCAVYVVLVVAVRVVSLLFNRHPRLGILKMCCLVYLLWLLGDVVSLYVHGTDSTALRSMICMLVMPPDDYHNLLVSVEVVPSCTNQIFAVRHKYDTGYILGIGNPELRCGVTAPCGEPLTCRCVFKNSIGRAILRKRFSPEYEAEGRGRFDFEYNAFDVALAREWLTVEISFVGDIEKFCECNPDARIYIRTAPQ